MEEKYQKNTLESCIQKALLLEKQNTPKNLLAYELMLNLPEDVSDVEQEEKEARKQLAKENLSLEEKKYIEAKLYVLNFMKKYRKEQ